MNASFKKALRRSVCAALLVQPLLIAVLLPHVAARLTDALWARAELGVVVPLIREHREHAPIHGLPREPNGWPHTYKMKLNLPCGRSVSRSRITRRSRNIRPEEPRTNKLT